MVAELFIIIPAFVMVLVVAANVFAYFSLISKMDAMANEIARQLYQYPGDSADIVDSLVANAMQKQKNRHFLVQASCLSSPDTYIQGRRIVNLSINWYPFGSEPLRRKWPFFNTCLKRRKKIYVPKGGVTVRP